MPAWFKSQWVVVSVINATLTPLIAVFGPLRLLDAFGLLQGAGRLAYDGNVILIIGALSALFIGALIGILEEWWWRGISRQKNGNANGVLTIIGFAAGAFLGELGYLALTIGVGGLLAPLFCGAPLIWGIGIALPIVISSRLEREAHPAIVTPSVS